MYSESGSTLDAPSVVPSDEASGGNEQEGENP